MRRPVTAIALTLLLAATPAAQDLNKARALLEQALEALKPAPVAIATPEALDQALAGTADVLTLSPSLVYPQPLTIRRSVTLQSTVPAVRMDRATLLPKILGGLTIAADSVTVIGVEFRHTNPLADVVTIRGAHVTLDRYRVLGDPVKGAKRGIAANGNGDVTIRRGYIDDTFQSYPGNDSQAICAWDMLPGLLIEDNYLSGGSETIMIGGADPSSEARAPRDVTIRGNTITKNPAWQALPIGVKNTLELKNARHVLIEDNDISESWGGHGQTGYLLSFKSVNQDGTAPGSVVEDVLVQRNRLHHGAGLLNLQGHDPAHPSGTLNHVTLRENTASDIDPKAFTGSDKLIQLNGPTQALTITANIIRAVNLGAVVYFYGPVPATQHTDLVITSNTWPSSTYGIFGEGSGAAKPGQVPPAWTRYVVPGAVSLLNANVVP